MIRQVSGPETYFVCSSESCTETAIRDNYQFHTQQLCCVFLCWLNSDMVALLPCITAGMGLKFTVVLR